MLFRNYFLLVLPFLGAGFLAILPVSIVFAALLLWCFFFFFLVLDMVAARILCGSRLCGSRLRRRFVLILSRERSCPGESQS